jgi:hypothetical protein
MIRAIFAATALLLLPTSVLAQTYEPAGSGALAGRSPHQTYRATPAIASSQDCPTAMHSQPGGKLPVYGRHALPNAGCDSKQIASSSDITAVQAD